MLQNPDINAESLGNLTAIMDEEKSFNNGKFRVKESFRKSYVYVSVIEFTNNFISLSLRYLSTYSINFEICASLLK